VDGVRALGLEVRVGLHTGECELIAEKVGGIAVHVCARIAAHAGPGEVLVSRTVKDLVAGSGIQFVDRGVQPLKGIPDDWHLFAVKADVAGER
jgi:class 3 adenylate cyclase